MISEDLCHIYSLHFIQLLISSYHQSPQSCVKLYLHRFFNKSYVKTARQICMIMYNWSSAVLTNLLRKGGQGIELSLKRYCRYHFWRILAIQCRVTIKQMINNLLLLLHKYIQCVKCRRDRCNTVVSNIDQ